MAYVNGTTHYNLPQTVGTDKRDWADTNQAFADVDAALFGAVDDVAQAQTEIDALTGRMNTAEENIADNTADIAGLDTRLTTAEGAITSQAGQITDTRQDLEDMICAYNEASATSTHAYAIGDYFIYNDVLYKATQAISIGDTIVPDTNCATTNVSTELLNHDTLINERVSYNDPNSTAKIYGISDDLLGTVFYLIGTHNPDVQAIFKVYDVGRVTIELSTDGGTTWSDKFDSYKINGFTPSVITGTTDANGNFNLPDSSLTMIISSKARGNYIVTVGNDSGTDSKFFHITDPFGNAVATTSVTVDYLYVNY